MTAYKASSVPPVERLLSEKPGALATHAQGNASSIIMMKADVG